MKNTEKSEFEFKSGDPVIVMMFGEVGGKPWSGKFKGIYNGDQIINLENYKP